MHWVHKATSPPPPIFRSPMHIPALAEGSRLWGQIHYCTPQPNSLKPHVMWSAMVAHALRRCGHSNRVAPCSGPSWSTRPKSSKPSPPVVSGETVLVFTGNLSWPLKSCLLTFLPLQTAYTALQPCAATRTHGPLLQSEVTPGANVRRNPCKTLAVQWGDLQCIPRV